jgi:hypothetical protein
LPPSAQASPQPIASTGIHLAERLRERRLTGRHPRTTISCKGVRLLFTVTETFLIPGRGIVLLPVLNPVGEEKLAIEAPLGPKRPMAARIWSMGGLNFLKVSGGSASWW